MARATVNSYGVYKQLVSFRKPKKIERIVNLDFADLLHKLPQSDFGGGLFGAFPGRGFPTPVFDLFNYEVKYISTTRSGGIKCAYWSL